jgi:hypothetical protein
VFTATVAVAENGPDRLSGACRVFSVYLANLTDTDKQARLEAIQQMLEPHGEFYMPSLRI